MAAIPENVKRVIKMKNKATDPRYPYTHACDFLRSAASWDEHGCTMSRSDASQARQLISLALGVDDKELADRLADTFLNYEPMIHLFNDNDERFVPPENAISYKIVSIAGMKQAHWLQPRSDIEIRDIKFCSECEFISNVPHDEKYPSCRHPKTSGIVLVNSNRKIHPNCPIKTVSDITIRHADGEYVRNVIEYRNEKREDMK